MFFCIWSTNSFPIQSPDPLANSAQWQELTEQTLSLEKLLHSQLDAQGREALDKMLCLEGQRLDLWIEELFSTGICLGLELGRLSSARQAPDPPHRSVCSLARRLMGSCRSLEKANFWPLYRP